MPTQHTSGPCENSGAGRVCLHVGSVLFIYGRYMKVLEIGEVRGYPAPTLRSLTTSEVADLHAEDRMKKVDEQEWAPGPDF